MARKGETRQLRPLPFAKHASICQAGPAVGTEAGRGRSVPGRGRRWLRPPEREDECLARWRAGRERGAGGSAGREARAVAPCALSRGRGEPRLPGERGFVRHTGAPRPQN